MNGFPWTALATLLVLIVYAGFGTVVSRARSRFGVIAPAVSGNIEFERRYRVQMNTLEQLPLLLPLIWLCSIAWGDLWGALGGLFWSVGRVIYARAYYADAAKRDIGFTIGGIPVLAMFVAVLVAIGMRWA